MAADIFLSYAREDQETARLFAEGLEAAGFTVWWDVTLRAGEAYDAVTEQALKDAKAVIVLWSKTSVESRWVRAEATHGDRNKTLAPVMIEPCERPIMFELTHAAELFHWAGDTDDPVWLDFVEDVRRLIAAEAAGLAAPEPLSEPQRPRRWRALAANSLWRWTLVGVIGVAAIAFFVGPQLAKSTSHVVPAAPAVDSARHTKCNALLEENSAIQARSISYLDNDLAARADEVNAQVSAGRAASEIYYPAIENTAAPIGDYPYLSHYWEEFSSCVNDNTLAFDAVAKDIPFPESFWNRTRDLRQVFARNWRGQGRALPDFMSNFAALCEKYRADRAARNPLEERLNCDL